MRFASADRRSLWLWCGLGVLAWLLLSSILGASPASAAERPDATAAALPASAAAAGQPRSSVVGTAVSSAAERTAPPTQVGGKAPPAPAPAPANATSTSVAGTEKSEAITSSRTSAVITASIATAPVRTSPAPSVQREAAPAVADAPNAPDTTEPVQPKPTKAKQNAVTTAAHGVDLLVDVVDRGAATLRGPEGRHERGAQPAREHAMALTAAHDHERAVRHAHSAVHAHSTEPSTSRQHARAAAPAASAATIPARAAAVAAAPESAPFDDQAPAFALSPAVSSGSASASGSSSLLLFAGDVADAASSRGAVRLGAVVHDDDRLPVGPAATTDCPPD